MREGRAITPDRYCKIKGKVIDKPWEIQYNDSAACSVFGISPAGYIGCFFV